MLRGANISYGNRRFELLLFDVDMKVSLFSKNGAKSIQIQICWLGPEKKAPREEGRYQQGPGLLDGWDHTLILWMLVISCHFLMNCSFTVQDLSMQLKGRVQSRQEAGKDRCDVNPSGPCFQQPVTPVLLNFPGKQMVWTCTI